MSESSAPVAGWYDDPEMALRLRWWDGSRWTAHSRPKPIVENVATEQAMADAASGSVSSATGSTVIAEPRVEEPYALSAPYSWSPGSPAVGSAGVGSAGVGSAGVGSAGVDSPGTPYSPAIGTPASAPQPLGTYGTRSRRPDELWNTAAQSIDYAPERSSTPAAWALAVTPLITVAAQIAVVVLSGFDSTPLVWVIGATIIPVLWIIVWVRRDRITLHEWGHLRRAHWGWAFLGALGYLTARTIVVRRQTGGRGWWPLLTNLAITAVLVNIGIFTPVLGVLRSTIF